MERATREAPWELLEAKYIDEVQMLSSLLEEASGKELEDGKNCHKATLRDCKTTKCIDLEFRKYVHDLTEDVDESDDWVESERSGTCHRR